MKFLKLIMFIILSACSVATYAKNKEKLADLLSNNLLTVCIGPITGKILDQYNINYIYPDTYTVRDMMELLFKTWRNSHGR